MSSADSEVSSSRSLLPNFSGFQIPEVIRRFFLDSPDVVTSPDAGSAPPVVTKPVTAPVPPVTKTTSGSALMGFQSKDPPRTHHEPIRPPKQRRHGVNPIAEPKPFDFECARLELLKLLDLRRDGDQVSYDVSDVLQRAILDHGGMAPMLVHELVRRITKKTEKRYDLVVTTGDCGAIFGARIADALIAKYDHGHAVAQRFLELFTPAPTDEVPHPPAEYRLKRARSGKAYPLSGKRVVFAVPDVTPETWPEVLRQAAFLRSEQANSAEVCIVAIARIGRLETDTPTGLQIDAIINFY